MSTAAASERTHQPAIGGCQDAISVRTQHATLIIDIMGRSYREADQNRNPAGLRWSRRTARARQPDPQPGRVRLHLIRYGPVSHSPGSGATTATNGDLSHSAGVYPSGINSQSRSAPSPRGSRSVGWRASSVERLRRGHSHRTPSGSRHGCCRVSSRGLGMEGLRAHANASPDPQRYVAVVARSLRGGGGGGGVSKELCRHERKR